MPLGSFVRARAGNPQSSGSAGQLTREQREQRGAQAKVPSNGATLNLRQPGQQNSSARRQSNSTVNSQAAPQPQPQQRRSGDNTGLEHERYGDRYDTDAESLDTTTHGQSLLQVGNSQPYGQQRDGQDGTEYSGSDEDFNEGFEYELQEEQQEHYPTIQQLVQRFAIDHMSREEQLVFLKKQGAVYWDEGNSYPTTTSGPPDGFPDNWIIDQEAPSDNNERQSSPSPVGRHVAGPSAPRSAQQAVLRAPKVPEPQQNMLKQTTVFQQGAGIRQIQRTTANLAVRGGGQHQTSNAQQLGSQQPGQANRDPEPSAKAAARQGPSAPGETRVQPIYQAPVHPARPTESAPPTTRLALVKPKEEPITYYEPITQDPIVEPLPGPVEDYDLPALYEKSYNELKAEDFDTVPRGQPQVLSDDMVQKPLEKRLTHVRARLDASDQIKFFRTLKTSEWEEAGDWFLEQFSSIIMRTKEARQKKRKLASDFEDEIEKRYRHVAKRQQHVKGALDKMKAQGEGLVPKSPRPSKSPKKV